MATLATMKDRIARETRRSNIATQIAEAISTAIDHYQGERLWFNVTRELTIPTVVNQQFYSATDDADIGVLEKIDHVHIETADLQTFKLYEEPPEIIERLSQQGTETGEPRYYCFYDNRLRLYPVPDDVYTIRISGQRTTAAPASDSEAGNPWMVEAERLIRFRALFELFAHVIVDMERAQIASGAAEEALTHMRIRTANKQQTGGWAMVPTSF